MNISIRKSMAAVLLAAGSFSLVACAGTSTKESTGQYVDDAVITTKVKSKFVEDKAVSALDIKVETFKGTVQLSGFANSKDEVGRAVDIAREVPGVKSVKNDIRLKTN